MKKYVGQLQCVNRQLFRLSIVGSMTEKMRRGLLIIILVGLSATLGNSGSLASVSTSADTVNDGVLPTKPVETAKFEVNTNVSDPIENPLSLGTFIVADETANSVQNFTHYKNLEPNAHELPPDYNDFDYLNSDYSNDSVATDVTLPEYYVGLTLRKCHCARFQTWNDGKCSNIDKTSVAVMDNTLQKYEINSSYFEFAEVRPLKECKLDYTRTLFAGGHFFFLPDLRLYHELLNLIIPADDFCIDHILDEQRQLSWQADVCIPPPSVPMCCPVGQGLNSNSKICENTTSSVLFNPPMFIQNTRFHQINGFVSSFECEENLDVAWVKLSDPEVSLEYTGDNTYFSWIPTGSSPIFKLPTDYCVAADVEPASQLYWASICYKDSAKEHIETCSNKTCVRKCCPEHQLFNTTQTRCSTPELKFDMWSPTFHVVESGKVKEVERQKDTIFINGNPLCADFFVLEPKDTSRDKFYLLPNGSLHVPQWELPIPSTSYCVDRWVYDDGSAFDHAMVCFPEKVAEISTCQRLSNTIYPSLLIVSCIFLTITLAVYVAVPELHAKVHGKSLVSHVSALLVSYTSLVVVQWGSSLLPMTWCIIMGKY